MSRRRYISTEMSLDEALEDVMEEAGEFAALLYTWLIPHADDAGVVKGSTREILARVLPLHRSRSPDDVASALRSLQAHGLLSWDEDAREVQFPAESFYRHQTYITAERRKTPQPPSPPTPSGRSPQNAANQRKTPQNAASFSSSFSSSVAEEDIKSSSSARAHEENAAAAEVSTILGLDDSTEAAELAAAAIESTEEDNPQLEARKCRGHYARSWARRSPVERASTYAKWLEKAALFRHQDQVKYAAPARGSPAGESSLPWLEPDPVDEAYWRRRNELARKPDADRNRPADP